MTPEPHWEIMRAADYYKNGTTGTVVLRNGYPSYHSTGSGSYKDCLDYVDSQKLFAVKMQDEPI